MIKIKSMSAMLIDKPVQLIIYCSHLDIVIQETWLLKKWF